MSTATPRRPAGFTLIELMIVTAIVGVLSSVAIPAYTQLTIRSRASERKLVSSSIKRGVTGLYLRDGKVDLGVSAANPPGTPGPAKQVFDNKLDPAWSTLTELIQFEGATYYQYDFTTLEPGGNTAATLTVHSAGDLDGDGRLSEKSVLYERREGQYWTDESDTSGYWCATLPAAGCLEDGGTF